MSSEIGMWRFSECAGLCVGEGVRGMIWRGDGCFGVCGVGSCQGLLGEWV